MLDKDTLQAVSIVATIIVAFGGYLLTYRNGLKLERQKAQMKFVSDQLQYLYGPLFSLRAASHSAWLSFRSRCRPGGAFFGREPQPNEQELKEWRLWMSEVFMPLNLKMEKAIIENAHLVEGGEMPPSFQELLAHVEVYKAVMKRWEVGDFGEHIAYINFPSTFDETVVETFKTLKQRQARLTDM